MIKKRQLLIDRIKQLEEQVKYLTNEVKYLKEESKEHEKIDYHIKPGEVAYCFEQSVCSFVLPQTFENEDQATIKGLLILFNRKISQPLEQIISVTEL